MKQFEALIARARTLGALPLAGAALIALALLLYLVAVVPLYDQVESLRGEVVQTRERLTGQVSPQEAQGEELSSFYGFFPESHSSPVWLGKIYGAAKETGVRLASGEYELQQVKDSRLLRYRISLPAHGSYEQVREFVAAVLQEVPAVSLDDIALRREDIHSSEVEARLRLTLYMGLER